MGPTGQLRFGKDADRKTGGPRYLIGLQGLGGHTRARAMANKPINITPPPEAKLLRIQLGPEQGTT